MTTRSHTTPRPKTRFALFPLLLTAACAGYEIVPVAPKDLEAWGTSAKDGYIIYEPDPYLRIVQTIADEKQSVTADIIYLPNRNRPYRVSTYAFLATADIKLTYNEGWQLTNAESNVDTASVAKAVLEAAAGLATKDVSKPSAQTNRVKLYRLEFDEKTGRIKSLEEVQTIEVDAKGSVEEGRKKNADLEKALQKMQAESKGK